MFEVSLGFLSILYLCKLLLRALLAGFLRSCVILIGKQRKELVRYFGILSHEDQKPLHQLVNLVCDLEAALSIVFPLFLVQAAAHLKMVWLVVGPASLIKTV